MAKGRPTKFNDQIKDAMLALYKKGRTDKQVAKAIGVSLKTLRNWRGKHPSFGVIVKDMKNIADAMVEASLFSLAIGDGCRADFRAQQFWLRNRQPKKWRAPDVKIEASPLEALTPEQIDARLAALLSKTDAKKDE